jgi:hypothetical protein
VSDRDDVATELRRVVDRLNSLPLAKVEPHLPTCHDMALFIVERTWELDATVPADVTLPTVGAGAAGAQLAVVGRDYLAAAEASHVSDLTAVGDRLVALRRSLP